MKFKSFKVNAEVTVAQAVNNFAKANFKIAEVLVVKRAMYMGEKCYEYFAHFHNWEELLNSEWKNKNIVSTDYDPETGELLLTMNKNIVIIPDRFGIHKLKG